MLITVQELTSRDMILTAAAFTTKKHDVTKAAAIPLERWLASEDSPIRAWLFAIYMHGIPSFVSTHLARHCVWNQPFIETNRPDRGGAKDAGRMTPVDAMFIMNAQTLINISRRRLCFKASKETFDVWNQVRRAIFDISPELFRAMVPDCEYRGRCTALKPCHKEITDAAKRTVSAGLVSRTGTGTKKANRSGKKGASKPRRLQPKPTP
jgi:hypothetical protein